LVEASATVPRPSVVAVVDDDEDVAGALASLVESMGHVGETFASADAFLARADAPIDLVISDVQMPGTSGVDLARILRGRGLPVILITAFPSAEIERQAREEGVRCFMRKPFDPAELIDCIERILAR
jgi:FixJ family two-component response regulator